MAHISALYVDDDLHLLDVCKIYLEKTGNIKVDTAISARGGQEKLAASRYDVIISDYEMPKMNGIEFLREVRKKFGDIPFIIFTGRGREEIVIEAINSGADFYLQKGGDPEAQFTELAHKIRQAVKSRKANISLQESEEKFREIFKNVNDAIHIHEIDDQGLPGKFVEANDVACRMLQYSLSELLKKSPLDFTTDYHSKPIDKIGNDLNTNGQVIFETFHIRKDGTCIPVEINAHVTSLMGKKRVVSVIRDISERKRQDMALRAELNLGVSLQKVHGVQETLETCLASAIEAAGLDAGGIYILDPETGNFDLMASKNISEEFATAIKTYPAESLNTEIMAAGKAVYFPGGPGDMLSPARDREGLKCLAVIPITREDAVIACLHATSHTASEIPENARITLETIAALIGVAIDRALAEEALARNHEEMHSAYEQLTSGEEELRQSYDELEKVHRDLAKREEQLRLLFDNMNEGVALHELVCDIPNRPADYRILTVNGSYERMTGLIPELVIGKTGREAYGTDEVPFFDIYSRVALTGIPESFETYFPPLQRHFHISVYSPRKNQFATIFSDISARKRAEETVRQKTADLEAAYEELTATEEELRQSYEELAASHQEIRRSEEKYRRIVETAIEGIWVMDADLRTIFANDHLAEFLGYSKDEMYGRTSHSFIPEGELPDHWLKIDERKSGRCGTYERRFLHKNGKVLWALVSATALIGDDGGFLGSFAMVTDITERKRAEEAERETWEIYKSLVQNASDMIRILDRGGRIRYTSPSTFRITGYMPEELIGKDPIAYIHPEDQTDVKEALEEVFEGKNPGIPTEFRIRRKDGTFIEVESVGLDLLDIRGIDSIITTTRPVPEFRRAERRLHKTQARLSDAFDLAGIANWEYDPAAGLFIFNDRFYNLYSTIARDEGGYQMITDRYIGEFVHPDDANRVREELEKALKIQASQGQYKSELSHRIIRRDGEIRIIATRYAVEANAEGRGVRIIGTIQDITELKKTENATCQANRQLSLLSGITRHDVLNSIDALNAYLHLCSKTEALPEVRSLISKMQAVTQTIRQQIEFTRLFKDIGVHPPRWQNADELLSTICCPPSLTLQNDIGGIEIFADPMLQKVFYNLLDNTGRHGGGATQIRISRRTEADRLVLIWEDNGKGIPPEDKEMIFERGFGSNSGLGLFFAREILALTNITIREVGETGKGARFEILIPKGNYRISSAE